MRRLKNRDVTVEAVFLGSYTAVMPPVDSYRGFSNVAAD
jgi:hypothetical protein